MVPLDELTQRRSSPSPGYLPPKSLREGRPQPRQPGPPVPRAPRRFRIVDVMTAQPVLDDGSTREAVDALKDVRSIVDVHVFLWDEEDARWRPLTFGEQRAMMALARE